MGMRRADQMRIGLPMEIEIIDEAAAAGQKASVLEPGHRLADRARHPAFPAAVHFLQGFDAGSFNQLVQANSYYSFSAIVMFAMGLIFQVPLFVVAIARAEIVSVRTLRKNRRYAIVLAALVGAALPGDAITMALETAPIVVLYEVGILVSALLARRDRRRERAAQRAGPTSAPPPPPPPPIASNDAL